MPTVSRPSEKKEFEKVALDEWINGTIESVEERTGVKKAYKDQKTGETKERVVDQVRFKFKLEGYEYLHSTSWMTNTINEKSNLYKFLFGLYGIQITPELTFNLDLLKGVKVKTMWSQVPLKDGTMFQFPDKVRPIDTLPNIVMSEFPEIDLDKEIPF